MFKQLPRTSPKYSLTQYAVGQGLKRDQRLQTQKQVPTNKDFQQFYKQFMKSYLCNLNTDNGKHKKLIGENI